MLEKPQPIGTCRRWGSNFYIADRGPTHLPLRQSAIPKKNDKNKNKIILDIFYLQVASSPGLGVAYYYALSNATQFFRLILPPSPPNK